MKTGHLVYFKDGAKQAEVIPFEYEHSAEQSAEKVAEILGLEVESWDYCTEGRYVALYDEAGSDYVECHATDNCCDVPYLKYYIIYDTINKRWLNMDLLPDSDSLVETSEEAIKLLSLYLFLNFDSIDKAKLTKMSEFAKRWGIPFSAEMIGNFTKMFTNKFPDWNWNSSSAYC